MSCSSFDLISHVERQRPSFQIAVVVSTSATMVTHAFLGSEYDAAVRDRVLALRTRGIFERRSVVRALLSHSVTDTTPLRQKLEQAITAEDVDAVAEAWIREKGFADFRVQWTDASVSPFFEGARDNPKVSCRFGRLKVWPTWQ